MATMKTILVFLLFVSSYGLSTEHLQQILLRNKRYAYPSPEPCVTDGATDNICFSGSESFPYQMSLLNVSAGSGIVIDNIGQRVAILDDSGRGIILDHKNQSGVQFTREKGSVKEFVDVVKDYNVSDFYTQHQKNEFSYDENGLSETLAQNGTSFNIDDFVLSGIGTFGCEASEYVKEIRGSENRIGGRASGIVYSLMRLFNEIMNTLSTVLAPIVTLATKGFLLLKPGILGIKKIFTTLAKFAKNVIGGVATLISSDISFPLGKMLSFDGLISLFLVLYEMSKKLTLAYFIQFLLKNPLLVYEMVSGLGGMILRGVTGIFTVLYQIGKLVSDGIISNIKSGIKFITKVVVLYFDIGRRNEENLQEKLKESAGLLTDLLKNETESDDISLGPLITFAEGILGKTPLKVFGINISEVIGILLNPSIKSGFEMATAIIKIFTPFKIPKLFNRAMADLFSNGVSLLSHENNLNYIRHIVPDVVLPPNGVFRIPAQDLTVLDLPTYELIERVPTLHTVFTSLDKYSIRYYNISLVRLLDTDPEFNNWIKLGIRRVVAY